MDGDTGFLVDGRSVSGVAARVAQLLGDLELATRMGKAGRDWITAQWRWQAQADRLRELLTGVAR